MRNTTKLIIYCVTKFKIKNYIKLCIKVKLTLSLVIPSKYVEPIIRSMQPALLPLSGLSPHCHQTKTHTTNNQHKSHYIHIQYTIYRYISILNKSHLTNTWFITQ